MKHMILAGCSLLIAFNSFAQTKKRPNIIMIMSDDHAQNAISTFHKGLTETPNIDRIGKEGLVFKRSYCTNSICAPSRAVIITGKFSHLNGHIDNNERFDSSQQTFPKLLQKAGYQTALVGKWHLISNPTGFNYWTVVPGQGQYYNPDFIKMDGKRERVEGYATNIITDKALNWLDGRDTTQPFCLLLYNKAPHRNWMPDTADFDKFRGRKYPLPPNFYDNYEGRTAAGLQEMTIANHMHMASDLKVDTSSDPNRPWQQKVSGTERMNAQQKAAWNREYDPITAAFKRDKLTGKALAEWKYQRYMEDYMRCIASVDRNVGRVLDYLDQHGLAENTIVIYTSDQGFYLGEHGWYDKRFMYEESLVMPMVMRYPAGIKKKGEVNEMVQNIDYAPTFLEYAGVKLPADLQGRSMKPLMEGKKTTWRDAIYYHYYEFPGEHKVRRHYGVRTDRYKLIHFYNNIDKWELYDLQKDPAEMKNVYGDPAYKGISKELHQKLETLRKQYKDDSK
jgi:arylsulfatase A-like enzyme